MVVVVGEVGGGLSGVGMRRVTRKVRGSCHHINVVRGVAMAIVATGPPLPACAPPGPCRDRRGCVWCLIKGTRAPRGGGGATTCGFCPTRPWTEGPRARVVTHALPARPRTQGRLFPRRGGGEEGALGGNGGVDPPPFSRVACPLLRFTIEFQVARSRGVHDLFSPLSEATSREPRPARPWRGQVA